MKKNIAVELLSQTRENFIHTIDQIPIETINLIPVEGTWTIKDILGHITAWEATLVQPMIKLAEGGEFASTIISDGEKFNQDQVYMREHMTLEKVKAEMLDVRLALTAAAALLPDEAWKKIYPAPWGGEDNLSRLVEGLAWHEDEHTQAIHKWLGEGK